MKSPEQFGSQSEQYKKQEEVTVASEGLFEDPEVEDLGKKDARIEQYEQLISADESTEIREIVSALYEPMKRMLESVLEKIQNGEFQILIGEDASGRIPALIVRKFIDRVYKGKQLPKIQTRFIAGTTTRDEGMETKGSMEYRLKYKSDNAHYMGWDEIPSVIEEKKTKMGAYLDEIMSAPSVNITDALIVTEYISSGNGLVPLMETLREKNITPTILSVYLGFSWDDESLEDLSKIYGGSILYGHGSPAPNISRKNTLSGVIKHFSDLHAAPARSLFPGDEREIVLAKMTIARDEANKVAEHLIAELVPPTESIINT